MLILSMIVCLSRYLYFAEEYQPHLVQSEFVQIIITTINTDICQCQSYIYIAQSHAASLLHCKC